MIMVKKIVIVFVIDMFTVIVIVEIMLIFMFMVFGHVDYIYYTASKKAIYNFPLSLNCSTQSQSKLDRTKLAMKGNIFRYCVRSLDKALLSHLNTLNFTMVLFLAPMKHIGNPREGQYFEVFLTANADRRAVSFTLAE